MTLGELRLRITQMFPGVGLEIIEGFISDVHSDILHELPWQRQNVSAVLETVAPYATGTLTLTNGSNAVTGAGTTFTAAMTGRALRVTGRDEIYTFTRTANTTGTLDRVYEGPDVAGAGYKIFQHIYTLPSNCRLLEENAFAPLSRLSRSMLPACVYGTPNSWASYLDDTSTPPLMRVQLDPIPDAAIGIPFSYQAETALPGTGVTLLPWIQTSALVEGVTAKLKAHLKDYSGAAFHGAAAGAALSKMRGTEAQGMEPMEMRLPSHYTGHRRSRW